MEQQFKEGTQFVLTQKGRAALALMRAGLLSEDANEFEAFERFWADFEQSRQEWCSGFPKKNLRRKTTSDRFGTPWEHPFLKWIPAALAVTAFILGIAGLLMLLT